MDVSRAGPVDTEAVRSPTVPVTATRYRVLGPIEVRLGDRRWREIPQAKWRALLAVLLINANHPVSARELQRQLWPDGTPSTARKLVQHYAGRLRRLLGDPGGHVLATRSSGYRLTVNPGELDVDQFAAAAATGQRLLARGDFAGAARHLESALSHWRGPALADVPDTPSVAAAADRLNEHRLAVFEARMRAALAYGPSETMVPVLQSVVSTYPLRERLRELLMVALYRAGRRCDALATCRDLRQLLKEEHGLEPDAAVQRLERAILRDEHIDLTGGGSRAGDVEIRPRPFG